MRGVGGLRQYPGLCDFSVNVITGSVRLLGEGGGASCRDGQFDTSGRRAGGDRCSKKVV